MKETSAVSAGFAAHVNFSAFGRVTACVLALSLGGWIDLQQTITLNPDASIASETQIRIREDVRDIVAFAELYGRSLPEEREARIFRGGLCQIPELAFEELRKDLQSRPTRSEEDEKVLLVTVRSEALPPSESSPAVSNAPTPESGAPAPEAAPTPTLVPAPTMQSFGCKVTLTYPDVGEFIVLAANELPPDIPFRARVFSSQRIFFAFDLSALPFLPGDVENNVARALLDGGGMVDASRPPTGAEQNLWNAFKAAALNVARLVLQDGTFTLIIKAPQVIESRGATAASATEARFSLSWKEWLTVALTPQSWRDTVYSVTVDGVNIAAALQRVQDKNNLQQGVPTRAPTAPGRAPSR